MTSVVSQSYLPIPASMHPHGSLQAGVVVAAASAAPTPRASPASRPLPSRPSSTSSDTGTVIRGSGKRKAAFEEWQEACEPFHANCPYTDEILCQCPFGLAADVSSADTATIATDTGLFPDSLHHGKTADDLWPFQYSFGKADGAFSYDAFDTFRERPGSFIAGPDSNPTQTTAPKRKERKKRSRVGERKLRAARLAARLAQEEGERIAAEQEAARIIAVQEAAAEAAEMADKQKEEEMEAAAVRYGYR